MFTSFLGRCEKGGEEILGGKVKSNGVDISLRQLSHHQKSIFGISVEQAAIGFQQVEKRRIWCVCGECAV